MILQCTYVRGRPPANLAQARASFADAQSLIATIAPRSVAPARIGAGLEHLDAMINVTQERPSGKYWDVVRGHDDAVAALTTEAARAVKMLSRRH